MFVLEESQLLADTIVDSDVLRLYKALLRNETSNDRSPFIDEILSDKKCLTLTHILLEFHCIDGSSLNESIKANKLTPDQKDDVSKKLNLSQNDIASLALVVSATLVQLFVIDNFVGPTKADRLSHSHLNLPDVYQDLRSRIDYRALAIDGSEVYHRIASPWLLRLAQICWSFLNRLGCSRRLLELEFLVWKHRYLTVHLMTLIEPAELIIDELRKNQDFIFDHHVINDLKENNTQLTRFDIVELCCELIQSSSLRGGITSCRKILDYATEVSGVSIEHTGVLGKRTKFQQTNIPQLVVKVKRNGKHREPTTAYENTRDLPKDIALDDDTLLPDISFVEKGESEESPSDEQILGDDAQLLMINKLDFIFKTEVMEESLKDEWTLAYLRSIIKSASIWSVKYKALALRSLTEKKNNRKMDRALLQLEELIKTIGHSDGTNHNRMKAFYSVLTLSSWQMQRSLGDTSYDLGLYKNALDVYSRIEFWEGIIKCYSCLGQSAKAEKVILQELDKQETPYLYCLLGDATDNIEYYEKSWSLSKGRFARAKKSIGTYHYMRKQYHQAIENYEQALVAQPTNLSILSLLAYSCLTIESYERAAECYRNITYIDDTNFLAWNNLSKAYIKLNQKERAWRTLREAIKCNFEEWKIWENFMTVSIEIGAIEDVITAWHRLIDLKASHKDDDVLCALTHTLTNVPLEKADADYIKILNDALKLVARLISTSDCSSRLWICYYKLLIKEYQLTKTRTESAGEELPKLDIDSRVSKIKNALQRATPTSLVADPNWHQVPDKVSRLLDCYDELVDCYAFAVEVFGSRAEIWKQWKYFKLSLSNVMKTLEKSGYRVHSQ